LDREEIAGVSIKKLGAVFKTVGLPQYTYVKPLHYGEIRSDIEQEGKHVLIEGPSGIGKTCVVFKVFEELSYVQGEHYLYVSCRDANSVDVIETTLAASNEGGDTQPRILFLDDFHILSETYRNELGDRLKRLSDSVFTQGNPLKLILVGIPAAGGSILASAGDLGPRLGGYRFATASDREVNILIDEGENALNVLFEDRDIILSEASGNFWLAQYVCNKICAIKEIYQTQIDTSILSFDLLTIRRRILDELSTRFMPVAVAFSKGKKWRPGGNKPYLEVLMALSRIPDSVVPFDKLLGMVPERRRPGIKAIRGRIREVICNRETGSDLRKQIAFEDPSFSIEDPLFRYFLTHLTEDDLYREIGLTKDTVDKTAVYTYDLAFSFAGQVRPLVEVLNNELKREDVVTFYDFDSQSSLIGANLEDVLRAIYSVSAKYYVVFLDDNYADRVWTIYERDIMTHSARSRHILPVVLTEKGKSGLVGVSSVLGRIDLSDVWSDFQKTLKFSESNISSIRNRAVLPIIEKIDEFVDDTMVVAP
jgi:hypothetical protein